MSLRCVIFAIITLIVTNCSEGYSLYVDPRVLKVIIPQTKNFSVPQIILMGDNLKGLRVTLTKKLEPRGENCNTKYMVTPPINTHTSNSENKSDRVYFYLSSSTTKNLSNLTNVWICLSHAGHFSSLSEISSNYLNSIWVHQGDISKIHVENLLRHPNYSK